jgi:hypothetical protein
MTITFDDIVKLLTGQYGVLVLLVLIFYAGYKKYWVFGWYAKELADRNEKVEGRLDRAVGIADQVTGLINENVSTKEVRKHE